MAEYKIKEITFKEHPILGNLTINFCKADGTPADTIIIAGENGVGKSTLLNSIGEIIAAPFDDSWSLDYSLTLYENNNEVKFDANHAMPYYGNVPSEYIQFSSHALHCKDNLNFSALYPQNKNDNLEPIESISDIKTQLKQMIDEAKKLDSEDLLEKCRISLLEANNSDKIVIESRYNKLARSINFAFDDIEFKGSEFVRNGKQIALDNLSSGEQQIIFRKLYLLLQQHNNENSFVLIDEPEVSLHPRWQSKIINGYRALFTHDGKQSVQMFLATHSEYVIKSAFENPNDVLIVILSKNAEVIEAKTINTPMVLPTITAAETNYRAFGITSIDYHILLYGYLQDKENLRKVKSCDDFIIQHTEFDANLHSKPSSHNTTTYNSLPTYIRNAINHPDSGNTYTNVELETSILLLQKLCR